MSTSIFEVEPEKEPEVPAGQKLQRHGYRWRTVRSMSIGLKPVVLKVKVPRWLNTTTGEEFEQTPFVEAYTKITRALARLIVDLARFMTLADIAGWLSLSWDTGTNRGAKAAGKGLPAHRFPQGSLYRD